VGRLGALLASRPGRAGEAQAGSGGYCPLHYAARAGAAPAVRLLLAAGAPVDARTTEGRATPLHRAATAGSEECVALL
jgi:ankyrin repeat protein